MLSQQDEERMRKLFAVLHSKDEDLQKQVLDLVNQVSELKDLVLELTKKVNTQTKKEKTTASTIEEKKML